jgi:acetyltransferase
MEAMKSFFAPDSIAVIGATERENSIGKTVMDNLLLGKDKHKIYPVNPNRQTILDQKCYNSISQIPETPDLAIIVTPAATVIESVEECAKLGLKAIIIASAGFKEIGPEGKAREEKIGEIASANGIRIIGPNCLGVIRPTSKLNATFVNKMAKPGRVAFLSQSGALGSAVLDWAVSRDVGFSAFVSLGSMLDVDFGDLIDFFGEDPETKSIIIYLESLGGSLTNAKHFMSAARGFARSKPIIVIKAGKFQESRQAAKSHTGAMVGEDLYFDAAFDRAGVVRVEEIEDLFNVASILNTTHLPKGPNLAIITNAGGPAILATDALMGRGGKLAQLSPDTIKTLNESLPPFWSHANPVDILGDADAQRYVKAISGVLQDPQVDGAVVIYTPQGLARPEDMAKAAIEKAKETNKPLLVAMMGDDAVAKARELFYEGNIPAYEFPEDAIRTYLYMYQYNRNLETLYETPEDIPQDSVAPKNYLKIMVRNHLREGQTLLDEEDSKKFLTTYGIQATNPMLAQNVDIALRFAASVGYPVVMKINSPDISHKSDVGGVKLNITSDDELRQTFDDMMLKVREHQPLARIQGVTIQKMIKNYDYELIAGSKKDPMLGPVIMFGLGGTEAEFYRDISIGLPPLNQVLARRILERTRTYRMLSQGFRNRPPVNLRLLDEVLVRVSNMIVDFPEIKELDINPLVVTENAVVALDARIIIDETVPVTVSEEHSHLIISPYPTKYTQTWRTQDGKLITLRPIRPEDEPLEKELLANLSPETSRFRFFYTLKEITHEMLSRFCNIDYEREMAIIAEYIQDNKRRIVGVARLIIDRDASQGEYAVLLADDFQSLGLGLKISDMLIGIAQEKKLRYIYGIVLNDNMKMIELAKKLGFTVNRISEEESRIELEL